MIVNSANLNLLNRGWKTIFMEAYQGGGGKMYAELFAMRTSSSSAEEFYGWLSAVPGMREMLGEAVVKSLSNHDYKISNREFESTVGVKRTELDRDNYSIYNRFFQAMGTAAQEHPDELLFEVMIDAFTKPCYTGKNFFDANHEPVKGGYKFSNKDTKKLSAANFVAARKRIKSRRNSQGRPMNLGRKLVLVVSPTWEDTARQILIADTVPNAAGTASQSNVNKGSADLEVCPRLSANEDAWFLLELGQALLPFINQIEKEVEFNSATNLSDSEILMTHEFKWQTYRRGNVGFGLPELAEGSTGEDAA